MLLEEKEYELGGYDRSDEYNVLISSVSSSLIIDNIIDQIDDLDSIDKLKGRNSIFKPLQDRMEYLIKKYPAGSDEYGEVYETIDNTLESISDRIEEKIGINIQYSEVMGIEKKIDYVSALYEFFVIRLEENLENFATEYLFENRDVYNPKLSADETRNNSYNYVKQFIDNEYTPLIYKIRNIINDLELPKLVNEDSIGYIVNVDDEEFVNYIIKMIMIQNQWVEVDHIKPFTEFIQPLINNNESLIQAIKFKLAKKLKEEL